MIHPRPNILNVLSFISVMCFKVSLNLPGYKSGNIPSIIKINAITKESV